MQSQGREYKFNVSNLSLNSERELSEMEVKTKKKGNRKKIVMKNCRTRRTINGFANMIQQITRY